MKIFRVLHISRFPPLETIFMIMFSCISFVLFLFSFGFFFWFFLLVFCFGFFVLVFCFGFFVLVFCFGFFVLGFCFGFLFWFCLLVILCYYLLLFVLIEYRYVVCFGGRIKLVGHHECILVWHCFQPLRRVQVCYTFEGRGEGKRKGRK